MVELTVTRRDKMHNKYAETWWVKMPLRVRANGGSMKECQSQGKLPVVPRKVVTG